MENEKSLIQELFDRIPEELVELDDFMVKTALDLRRVRLQFGLSQKQAAQKANISQAMVSKLESGDYNPSIEVLWNYMNALGATIEITASVPKTESIAPEYSFSNVIVFKERNRGFRREQEKTTSVDSIQWEAK